jgi:ribosome maturation protein SDO1
VLQIPQVFLNVSKGQVAGNEDLKTAFGTTDVNEIVLQILKKGELQVGGKERQQNAQQLRAEVLQIVADKCINPNTKRPYPITIIDKTLNELNFNLVPSRAAKTQALEAIKLLVEKQVIPISRARMRVRVTGSSKEAKKYADKVRGIVVEVQDEDWGSEWELIAFIDPGSLRPLDELVRDESKGKATVEVLDTAVVKEGDENF